MDQNQNCDENRALTDDEIRQIIRQIIRQFIDLHNQNRRICSEIANRFHISHQRVSSMIREYQKEIGILSKEDEEFILKKIKDNLEIPTKAELTNAVNSYRTSRGINTKISKKKVSKAIKRLRER